MEKTWLLKIDEESKLPSFQQPEKEGDLARPIYISPEGKEVALDPVGMYGKILEMGKTEKELRGNHKRLEGQLQLFADIEDVAVWKEEADKALTTVANFNDKDWMKAEKVEKLKEDMNVAHSKKLKEVQESFSLKEGDFTSTITKKDGQIRKLMVSNKFATHPLFSGRDPKTSLPPEIAETYFGKNFKVEENESGELILRSYYDSAGNDPVYSHESPGELAEFTEAMFSIFEKYPGSKSLMKSSGSGTGGTGGTGAEGEKEDEIAKLEKQYAAAVEARNVQLQIALKNRLHNLRQKQKAKAAA